MESASWHADGPARPSMHAPLPTFVTQLHTQTIYVLGGHIP